MKKKALIIAVLVLLPSVGFAQTAGVGVLSLGGGSWNGATRVLTATVAKGAVRRVATVGLSAAASGGILLAVDGAMVLSEPLVKDGVDAIRTYLATAGFAHSAAGTWTKAGPAVKSSTDATCQAQFSSYSGACCQGAIPQMVVSSADLGPLTSAWLGVWGGSHVVNCSSCAPTDRWYTAGQYDSTNPSASKVLWLYPKPSGPCAGTVVSNPGAPVPATPGEVKTKVQTDITAGSAQAKAAVEEAENVARRALVGQTTVIDMADGTKVNVPPSVMDVQAPSDASGGYETPRQELMDDIVENLPQETIDDMAEPAEGTQAVPEAAKEKEYIDPAYSGRLNTTPWPDAPNFATRWTAFKTAIAASPVFQLPTGIGSVPSGGSSVISFNAGVFGSHSVDFSTWPSSVFSILSGLVMVACSFVAIKIVTLKHA